MVGDLLATQTSDSMSGASPPASPQRSRILHAGDPPEVHQATGMISVQLSVTIGEAFARLRARAFADDRPLSELATDVITRRIRFTHDDTG
jgi:hypothetical protein